MQSRWSRLGVLPDEVYGHFLMGFYQLRFTRYVYPYLQLRIRVRISGINEIGSTGNTGISKPCLQFTMPFLIPK